MERRKATLSDILGSQTPCYFSSQGERPFRYSDKCRNCNGIKICENYIPSQQTKPHYPVKDHNLDSDLSKSTRVELTAKGADKPADTTQSRQTKPHQMSTRCPMVEEPICNTEGTIGLGKDKPADKQYSPMIVRPKWKTKILPKNYQNWIQKYRDNQDGVV